MRISAIAAMAHDRVIGKDNGIPWHLPADMRYFKQTTLNKPIIMGRKNFEAIGKPLPKRINIVLTSQKGYQAAGAEVVHTLAEALKVAKAAAEANKQDELFIIGGGVVYTEALPFTERVYLTKIELDVPGGDVFFPELPEEDWQLVEEEPQETDANNVYPFSFNIYERKEEH